MINWKDVLKTADELGIKYEKVENGQGGIYLEGSDKKLTSEEMVVLCIGESHEDTLEELQSMADILDYVEYMCDALYDAEYSEDAFTPVKWRAVGYKEISDMIKGMRKSKGLKQMEYISNK